GEPPHSPPPALPPPPPPPPPPRPRRTDPRRCLLLGAHPGAPCRTRRSTRGGPITGASTGRADYPRGSETRRTTRWWTVIQARPSRPAASVQVGKWTVQPPSGCWLAAR